MTSLRDLLRREPKPGLKFPRWLDRLVSIGIVATDPQVVRRQRCVNVAALAIAANTISHLVINSLHDFDGLFIVNIYNVLMIAILLLVPQMHRLGEHAAAIALILIVLFGHLFVVWAFGLSSELQVYYTLGGGILLFFGVENLRQYLVFFVMFVVVLLFALNFAPVEGLVDPEDDLFRNLLSSQAMINTLAMNAAILFYALTALRHAEIELEEQHARSEALLEIVMPHSIAERLKSGREQRIADRIETLSVLFADLVDFTGAAHDLPPEHVVEFLDALVRGFDALAAAHGVEKIKTMGDSYMAAAGFDGRGAEGAIAVGRFALAMLEAVERQQPLGGRKLKMRIGIHSGPATAGVIGDSRISYDVWGDAVNVASRMESQGLPGRIQVSEAFRDLAGSRFVFEERGTTDFKGVGAAHTFFLTGPAAS